MDSGLHRDARAWRPGHLPARRPRHSQGRRAPRARCQPERDLRPCVSLAPLADVCNPSALGHVGRSLRRTFMPSTAPLYHTTHRTPVGLLTLIASDRGLRAILWPKETPRHAGIATRTRRDPNHPILRKTAAQLDEYFAGSRTEFDVPLDLEGTRFQLAAWRALADIPFGGTTSYGQQARALGIPTAARALGAANRANPVCIVLPCHRVIGAHGALTGFAGGLPTKQWLLDHEARVLMATFVATPHWERRGTLYSRLPMPGA